jgi:uncharacterized protein YcgL (UPF0745 family)
MTTQEHRKAISSYPQAMMDYFGKRGETADFLKELKSLSDADKAEFREMLKAEGYNLS